VTGGQTTRDLCNRHTVLVHWPGRSRVPEPADILVVCTGNVCRSPYIAAALRAALPDLTITSTGTSPMTGQAPGEFVARALAERGIQQDLAPARRLTRGQVRGARLIITAARVHRVAAIALDAAAAGRAFTLKELARVIDSERPGGVDAVVAQAAKRAQVPETTDHDDDLEDPFGLAWPAYQRMAAEVDTALTVLIPALGG